MFVPTMHTHCIYTMYVYTCDFFPTSLRRQWNDQVRVSLSLQKRSIELGAVSSLLYGFCDAVPWNISDSVVDFPLPCLTTAGYACQYCTLMLFMNYTMIRQNNAAYVFNICIHYHIIYIYIWLKLMHILICATCVCLYIYTRIE